MNVWMGTSVYVGEREVVKSRNIRCSSTEAVFTETRLTQTSSDLPEFLPPSPPFPFMLPR